MANAPPQAAARTMPLAQAVILPQQVQCTRKHILMIVGSLREDSLNLQLAQEAAALLGERAKTTVLNYARLPWFNQNAEFPSPMEIQRVRIKVLTAHGLWFFTPEYNSSYPGVLKNLLDWLSRPLWECGIPPGTAIQGKKAAISGAGGRSAASGARQKLTELLKTIQAIPMEVPQTGVALTPKSLARGRLVLSPQEQMVLRNQAEAFLRFLEETGCPEAH